MTAKKEAEITHAIFVASLLFVAIPATFQAYRAEPRAADAEPWTAPSVVLSACIVLALFSFVVIRFLSRRGLSVKLFLALAALNVTLVFPELALRAIDFRHEFGIQFGYPRPTSFHELVPDSRLGWRLKPGDPNFLNSKFTVNSLGFYGPEIPIPKPDGVYRVMYLGDSCTQSGYPFYVEAILNRAHPGGPRRFDTSALAVAGYTSHQGRLLAEMYGESLAPDVVVTYFGWNDHWRAYGAIDDKKVISTVAPKSRLQQSIAALRLVQAAQWLAAGARNEEPLDEPRVPPDNYKRNLSSIAKKFRERNTPIIFVTAPTSMYVRGVPDYLIDMKFGRNKNEIVSAHKAYNQIVRDVCAETGAILLDLERDIDAIDDIDSLFLPDTIHMTEKGLALVAETLSKVIDAKVLAPR